MATYEEFKSKIRISQIIAKSIKLKRAGRDEHIGLCPFHQEKSPSFTVNDAKGFYHCFGCNQHGDVIDFVREHDGLDFRPAVEKIAAAAGIEAPAESARSRSLAELYRANEAAAAWFRSMLDDRARGYLDHRGVGPDLIERFEIGHAPRNPTALIQAMKANGVTVQAMEAAGLVYVGEDGCIGPRFRDRITFPVRNRQGRLVGFTARAVGEARAKYLNTRATDVFDKGRLLYGASQVDRRDRSAAAVLVEGAMDVIALARAGLNVAVAPLGTACTTHQLLDLWAMSDCPLVCLDGDEAGLRAGRRLIEVAMPVLRPGKSLGFVRLPGGKDPDDIVTEEGSAAMARHLARPIPMLDFLWRFEARGIDARAEPHVKAALHQRVKEAVLPVPDAAVRQALLADIRQRWNALVRDKKPAGGFLRMPTNMTEAGLLGYLLACPGALEVVEDDLEAMNFTDGRMESARVAMARWSMEGYAAASGLEEYLIASGQGDGVASIKNSIPYRRSVREGHDATATIDAWRSACVPYFADVEERMTRAALDQALETGDDNEILAAMSRIERLTQAVA